MKTLLYKLGMLLTFVLVATGPAGCGDGHKREERKIQKERQKYDKATADIGDAVKATDEAGWDSVSAYKTFGDTARAHLARNRQILNTVAQEASRSRHKISLPYRKRLKKLKDRNEALAQRLAHAPVGCGQAAWEDYSRLYSYDMQRLERDISRFKGYLPGKNKIQPKKN